MRHMWLRAIAGFRKGAGLAAPALIVVWLVLGAGLLWLGWYVGLAGTEAHSGTVMRVSLIPTFETYATLDVTIDSSSYDFFFDNIDFPQLPDVRIGDHVDILTQPSPEGYAIAIQSQRGTWIDTIYGDQVRPFTPRTWPLHEAVRWTALVLGILTGLFGVASLIRWLPSGQPQLATVGGTPASSLPSEVGASSEVVRPESAQAPDATSEPVVETVSARSRPASIPAEVGVWVGRVTVTALPILDFISITAAYAVGGRCGSSAWWSIGVLIGVPIALAVGGITTLIFAASGAGGSSHRIPARGLGIVALALAVVSVPINFFILMGWAFCLG